jgi:membrane-associated phospholipid phosphatase
LQDLNDAGQPLITINAQRYLLDQYKNSTDAIGEGISAFPSLHVAMAALVAIFFYDINRVIGAMAIIFCAIIFIGSIVLGWHYAIDGIASLFAVPIFWRLSKWTWGRFPMLSVRMSI